MTWRIGIFAGSREGSHDAYQDAVRTLGQELARREVELVSGGDHSGLAHLLVESTIAAGGRVMSVITIEQWLLEDDSDELSPFLPVASSGEYVQEIIRWSDALLFLPGGYGTMKALFEVLFLVQRGVLHKPIGLLDTKSFFAPWLRVQRHLVMTRLASKPPCLFMAATASRLLDELLAHLDLLSQEDPP